MLSKYIDFVFALLLSNFLIISIFVGAKVLKSTTQFNEMKLNSVAFVTIQDIEVIGRWNSEHTPFIKRDADGLAVVHVLIPLCVFVVVILFNVFCFFLKNDEHLQPLREVRVELSFDCVCIQLLVV